MKKLMIISLLAVFSTSSHAIHIYRSLHCSNSSHKLDYKGNNAVGGSYGISKIGSEEEVELFEMDGESDDSFKIEFLDSKTISKSENPAVCVEKDSYEYSEEVTQSIDLIKVLRLTSAEEATIGLKSGTVLDMNCLQVMSYPEKCE